MIKQPWITFVALLAAMIDKYNQHANAVAERFVWSVKHECLNRLILTNQEQLEYAVSEFINYYHEERIHQGIGRIIQPKYGGNKGKIICIERLGGL
jgi:transposase InsO family protein